MNRPRRLRTALGRPGPWVVLLALAGLWLGHTLEDIRVRGTTGLGLELAEPTYMLPMGALLAVLGAIAGARVWWLWVGLSRRLDGARDRLRALWRNHDIHPLPRAIPGDRPSLTGGTLSLGAPLAVLQIALYVVQENLEALLDGGRAPGLGAITGVHWAAPAVQALVAVALAAVATLIVRRLSQRRDAVRRVEALVTSWARRLRASAPSVEAPDSAVRSPFAIHGSVLWCRPPPPQLAA